jgi:DNA uptake protein ComE-like DNA-binding protein
VLDFNEDDGEQTAPRDNQDGQLLAGILEYVTVYSRQPNTRSDGSRRVNIANAQGRQQTLGRLLFQRFGGQRAVEIIRNVGDANLGSVAEFMVVSRMTPEEFAQIHADVTASAAGSVAGLVNVNTASATVLACIPGIGPENAATLVAYRAANPDVLTSFAWLTQILPRGNIVRAGPYLTDQSYQFSADVAAVGRLGRGYGREKVIFDLSTTTPRIVYRQDLSPYGWALGARVRQAFKGPKET